MNMIMYRGYIGQVTLDEEAGLLHGQVLNTRDVITFQGRSVRELHKALKHSVDDYIAFCAERVTEADDDHRTVVGKVEAERRRHPLEVRGHGAELGVVGGGDPLVADRAERDEIRQRGDRGIGIRGPQRKRPADRDPRQFTSG